MRRIFFTIIILAGLWLILGVCTIPNSKGIGQTSKAALVGFSEVDTQKLYKMVDKMPLYKKCDPPSNNRRENRSCSTTAINQYIYPQLEYSNNCGRYTGRITAELLIDRKGNVENVRIKKSFGCEELDQQILSLLRKMPPWETMGMQNNIPVKVIYTIPIQLRY